MRKHESNSVVERGFTLIEVMVAILILTIGLLSLAQMMALATNANALSGRMTATAALAKEQLELLANRHSGILILREPPGEQAMKKFGKLP